MMTTPKNEATFEELVEYTTTALDFIHATFPGINFHKIPVDVAVVEYIANQNGKTILKKSENST